MNKCSKYTHQIPFEAWPKVDQTMWERLVASDGLFGEDGPLAHLRPASLEFYREGYGRWLAWLQSQDVDLETAPVDRVTQALVAQFVTGQPGLAPRTLLNCLAAVLRILGAAYPLADLAGLRRAVQWLRREAEQADRQTPRQRLPDAQAVLALGRQLFHEAHARPACDWRRPVAIRDAVMLMFLVRHPLRRSNFAGLTLGKGYLVAERGHFVLVRAGDAKESAELGFNVDPEIAEAVALYLREARPQLLPVSGAEDALWLSQKRGRLAKDSIWLQIGKMTQAHLGLRLSPHDFRDIGATAMARSHVTDPRLRRGLLAHKDGATTDRFYNQATSGEALADYARLMVRLTRKRARTAPPGNGSSKRKQQSQAAGQIPSVEEVAKLVYGEESSIFPLPE